MTDLILGVAYFTGEVGWWAAKTITLVGVNVAKGAFDSATGFNTVQHAPAAVVSTTLPAVTMDAVKSDLLLLTSPFILVPIATLLTVIVSKYLFGKSDQLHPSHERSRIVPNREPRPQSAVAAPEDLDLTMIRVTNADHPGEMCSICRTNKKSICYNACKHVAICSACAQLVTDKKCPLCREVSTSFLHVVV